MKKLVVFLAAAGVLAAQNVRTSPPSSATLTNHTLTLATSGTVRTDGTVLLSDGSIGVASGGGIASFSTPVYDNAWCMGGNGTVRPCNASSIPVEIRKDDKKGPTLLEVKASAKKLSEADIPPVNYVKAAKDAGVDSAVVEEARMLELIHSLDIKPYDWLKVDNFLYRQALREGAGVRWVWKPVRQIDLKEVQASAASYMRTIDRVGYIYPRTYSQRLPMRILNRMKEIECEIPEAVFLVSDYEVVKPDPFLAVTTRQLLDAGKIWIIDRWDEPSFDDGPKTLAAK